MRRAHGALAVLWAALTIPGVTIWKESIVFVIVCSTFANAYAAVSAWQAARAEDAANS